MGTLWEKTQARIERDKADLVAKHGHVYLLVCTETGKSAVGNINDGHGGLVSAGEAFDRLHGRYEPGQKWREFFGTRL